MTPRDDDLPRLPSGWAWTTTTEVCSRVTDGTHDTPKYVEEGVPLVTSKNLTPNGIDFTTARNISIEDHKKISVRSGVGKADVLFAMIGTIGNPVVVNTTKAFGIKNVALFKKNESAINSKYLRFWLGSSRFSRILATRNLLKGTTQKFIPLEHLRVLPIPLAPINEQYRIVAKVEELFTNLDAGVESLRKVETQSKRYRQAVLRYAFEGKLTEEWRKIHTGLRPVLARESPVVQSDNSSSSNLPREWLLLTIPDIVAKGKNSIKRGPFGSSIRKEFFVPSGYKVYEQKNVIYSNFSLGNYYIGEDKFLQLKDFELKSGDIVITCSGTIGKIAIAPADLKKGIINQALLKLTLDEAKISAKYFLHLFTSKMRDIILDATRGSAMKNISSVKDLKQMLFPIPPLTEQQEIVEEIEQRFSVADEIEKIASQTASQAEQLRQGILKQAFEGKIVPQDPSDEPADKLLQRIRGERTKSNGEKETNKKKIKPEQVDLSTYVK